jgi:hypothetical protein
VDATVTNNIAKFISGEETFAGLPQSLWIGLNHNASGTSEQYPMVIESTNEPNFTKNSDYKTIEHND